MRAERHFTRRDVDIPRKEALLSPPSERKDLLPQDTTVDVLLLIY